jgi:hypothetical protein
MTKRVSIADFAAPPCRHAVSAIAKSRIPTESPIREYDRVSSAPVSRALRLDGAFL